MSDNRPGTRTLGIALRTSTSSVLDAEVMVLAGNGAPSGATVGGKTLATSQAAIYYRQDASSTDGFAYLTVDGGTNWSAIDAGAVDLNLLSSGVLDPAADSIVFIDADDSNSSKKESAADYATSIAGEGLAATAGVLGITLTELTNTTLDVAADSLAFIDASDSNASKKTTFDDVATQMAGDGINNNVGTFDFDLGDLTATTLDVATDYITFEDVSDGSASRRDTLASLATAQAGTGLTATAGVLSVNTSDSSTASVTEDTPAFRVERFTNPKAPANIVAPLAGDVDESTWGNITQPDTSDSGRGGQNAQVVFSAGPDWDGGDIEITGLKTNGNVATETITAVPGATVQGVEGWIYITRVRNLGTHSAGTATVQTGLALAVPIFGSAALVATKELSAGTVMGSSSISPAGLVSVTDDPLDGTNDYLVAYRCATTYTDAGHTHAFS